MAFYTINQYNTFIYIIMPEEIVIKIFIPSTEQLIEGSEEQVVNYRDNLASQGVIFWILTIN